MNGDRRRLPPELIDQIIDYLYWRPEDLRACALVCKAWLPSSRFHLFYEFGCDLGYAKAYPSYHRLYNIIQESPHISLYFREFICNVDQDDDDDDFPGRSMIEALLPRLIRSFTNLRMLEIIGWMDIPFGIQKAILDILDYPSLIHLETDLHFPTIDSFMRLIHPQLKRLDLTLSEKKDPLWFDGLCEDESSAVQKRCSLAYLQLRGEMDYFLDWLLGKQAIIDISGVRTLHVHLSQRFLRLVRSIASSLERLTVHHFNEDWSTSSILTYFRTLTVLHR
jgi:hypothetical protein